MTLLKSQAVQDLPCVLSHTPVCKGAAAPAKADPSAQKALKCQSAFQESGIEGLCCV